MQVKITEPVKYLSLLNLIGLTLLSSWPSGRTSTYLQPSRNELMTTSEVCMRGRLPSHDSGHQAHAKNGLFF